MAVQGSDYFIIERSSAVYHVLASDILAYMEANLGTAQFEVADIAARNALGNVSVGDRVFVTDASADATVSSGWAVYMYRGSSAWTKVAEEESLDITLQDTDLGYTASATQGVVTSSTGDNATIPAADGTNAGLMVPAQFTKLAGIEAGADVTDAANVAAAGALMDGANVSIAKAAATLNLGSGGNAGPHILAFYDAAGTIGIQQVYRTISEELIWEDLNGADLMLLDKSGNLTVSGSISGSLSWDDIVDPPATFTPSSHTHTVSQITDFDPADYLPLAGGTMTGALNAARIEIGTNTVSTSSDIKMTANSLLSGGESFRILFGRDSAGFVDFLDGESKGTDGTTGAVRTYRFDANSAGTTLPMAESTVNRKKGDARYSQLGHGHAISDVTGLQGALDDKADDADLHTAVELTGNANTNPLTISGQTLGFSISQLTAAP